MLFVFVISLWKECRVMDNGVYFAQMRHRDWQIAGVNNLRNFIQNMKERARQRKLYRHKISGLWQQQKKKSNQHNLGTIKSYNLCTEIIEYTSTTETSGFNCFATICQGKGVPIESQPSKLVGSRGSINGYFDFDKLAEVSAIVTTNLSKIVGVNFYPVETSKNSNLHHRPIGIGVQGLADTFIFCSPEAQDLNKEIFETICYYALEASSNLAAKESPL
nr:ribonucleoside-diphosphate reductase large subunit [Ipomoea batatas]GMD05554.1 ribonucleoside-diphosphate reductase large subunit [Ipomoea batatas]